MIRAIIIDDEVHCTQALEIELNMHCSDMVEVIATTNGSKEALTIIPKLKPDLIFLDIEMPWKSGFELLQELEPIAFDVIFVTAYDQYAMQAFKYSAVDYLLKPIDDEELRAAVKKVKNRKPPLTNLDHYNLLMENINNRSDKFPKIALKSQEGLEFVLVSEIIRIQSESNYATVHMLSGEKMVIVRSLKELENLLKPHNFFRTHQSHLINPLYVKSYMKADGGYLIMEDSSRVVIARDRKKRLLETLGSLGGLF